MIASFASSRMFCGQSPLVEAFLLSLILRLRFSLHFCHYPFSLYMTTRAFHTMHTAPIPNMLGWDFMSGHT